MRDQCGVQRPAQGSLTGFTIRFVQDLRPGDRFILVEQAQRQVVTQRLEDWEPDPDEVQVFELAVTGPGKAEMRGRHPGRTLHFRPRAG